MKVRDATEKKCVALEKERVYDNRERVCGR